MKDFRHCINGSVLPTVQQAIDTLRGHKDSKSFVNRIQLVDPYTDKRFAPTIARWITEHNVTPEEHAEDIVRFKRLRRQLKDLRIPADNTERKRLVKELLSKGPDDFQEHYSTLQEWNRAASDILDPDRDLSDDGLPVVMRHDGYTMYRIDTKKHCEVPLVMNSMSWCVTKRYFGEYGGPPYYPIVRDHDREPFCMVIPSHFDEDPDQAVRNANNDGRISPRDLAKIRPLLQHVLPPDRHTHPYINGVHETRDNLPKDSTPFNALKTVIDFVLMPGEWPEGEQILSKDPALALMYALGMLKGPFPQGELAIAQNPQYSYLYAKRILKGPFPQGEPAISRYADFAYLYALHVIKGPFPQGEQIISQDPEWAYLYAQDVLMGPWPEGEPAIASNPEWSCEYARNVIKGPFPQGEQIISQAPEWAHYYALHVIKGPFPQGEQIIS